MSDGEIKLITEREGKYISYYKFELNGVIQETYYFNDGSVKETTTLKDGTITVVNLTEKIDKQTGFTVETKDKKVKKSIT